MYLSVNWVYWQHNVRPINTNVIKKRNETMYIQDVFFSEAATVQCEWTTMADHN